MFEDFDSPDNNGKQSNDIDSFFAELDTGAKPDNNGADIASQAKMNELNEIDTAISPSQPKKAANPEDGIDWSKRYEDSSREALKLRERLDELEPQLPLIESLQKDDEFRAHVKSYFTPRSEKSEQELQEFAKELDEDFDFDMKRAITDPNSVDAQVLRKVNKAMTEPILEDRISTSDKQRQRADETRVQREALMNKYNMSVDEIDNLLDWSKSQTISLEDILFLRRRQEHMGNAGSTAKQKIAAQMNNVRSMPNMAIGGDGGAGQDEVAPDDAMFNFLLKDELGGSIFNPK